MTGFFKIELQCLVSIRIEPTSHNTHTFPPVRVWLRSLEKTCRRQAGLLDDMGRKRKRCFCLKCAFKMVGTNSSPTCNKYPCVPLNASGLETSWESLTRRYVTQASSSLLNYFNTPILNVSF